MNKKWSDLPYELLSGIADRLGLIEHLCFRGVCKDWNSASETASAEIESLPDHEPWFLLYGGSESSQCHLVTESGKNCKNELLTVPVNGTVIWNSYEIVRRSSKDLPAERALPFIQAKQEFKQRDMNRLLGLEENVSVSVCGTFCRRKTYDEVVFNEMIEAAAAAKEEEEICHLKGVWIQPRFFKFSPELSW
ncbi:hypothetical protein HS088_TW18G00168 [Tripterygium wilfordii]|uniref:F-box domain-containing protein n=1 Tax=Tripterygium wilfordii TaxID=458696 RepID=A0A7J7CBM1_TRIWF|nr:hypothetical protein HS088_TW18G00168 [Tripterygium wilfordii]